LGALGPKSASVPNFSRLFEANETLVNDETTESHEQCGFPAVPKYDKNHTFVNIDV
jgi:hypothetical protein